MAQVKIQGSEKSLINIFNRDYIFKIPYYQRPYSWTEENAHDLYDDIFNSIPKFSDNIEESDPYFLGSIVLIKEENRPDSFVVDGQQRLTTLIILFSAIMNKIDPEFSAPIKKYLKEEGDVIASTPSTYRLILRNKDQDFFIKYVYNSENLEQLNSINIEELSDSQKNIANNAKLFLSELYNIDSTQRVKLAKYIIQKCMFIVVTAPNFDSAFRIFTILNDRGLNLSPQDIIKADVLNEINGCPPVYN